MAGAPAGAQRTERSRSAGSVLFGMSCSLPAHKDAASNLSRSPAVPADGTLPIRVAVADQTPAERDTERLSVLREIGWRQAIHNAQRPTAAPGAGSRCSRGSHVDSTPRAPDIRCAHRACRVEGATSAPMSVAGDRVVSGSRVAAFGTQPAARQPRPSTGCPGVRTGAAASVRRKLDGVGALRSVSEGG